MATLQEVVVSVLSPYVGPIAADTCVRATALSIGKSADTLSSADLGALETNVKRLLGPIAPADTIARVITEIEGGMI